MAFFAERRISTEQISWQSRRNYE